MNFRLYREIKLSADQVCSDLVSYELVRDPCDRELLRDEVIDACKFIISVLEAEK